MKFERFNHAYSFIMKTVFFYHALYPLTVNFERFPPHLLSVSLFPTYCLVHNYLASALTSLPKSVTVICWQEQRALLHYLTLFLGITKHGVQTFLFKTSSSFKFNTFHSPGFIPTSPAIKFSSEIYFFYFSFLEMFAIILTLVPSVNTICCCLLNFRL